MSTYKTSKSSAYIIACLLPVTVGATDFQNENKCLEGLNSVSPVHTITAMETTLYTVSKNAQGQQQNEDKPVTFSFSKADPKSSKIHYVYTDSNRYKCDTSNIKSAEFYRFVLPRVSGQSDGYVNIKISEERNNRVSYRHYKSGDQYVALFYLGKATAQFLSNQDPKKVMQNIPDYTNSIGRVDKEREDATRTVVCTESLDKNSETVLRDEIAARHSESSVQLSKDLNAAQVELADKRRKGLDTEQPRRTIQRLRASIDKSNKACEGIQTEMNGLITTQLDTKPADALLQTTGAGTRITK